MNKTIAVMFMTVSYIFLTGCASTIAGVREDVSKPFKWVGSVGDKIAPCHQTKNNKCVKDE